MSLPQDKTWLEQQMFEALSDAEEAFRWGDHELALHCIFVWSQAKDRIISGEQSWFAQRIPDPLPGGHGQRSWNRHTVEGELVDSVNNGSSSGEDS